MIDGLNKPLYVQIQEHIADLILSGKLLPDSKIPSEREFSDELGVSRMTVRKAITELVSEGLLERQHGSGTYVARPRVTYESHELVDHIKAIKNRNLLVGGQLIEFSEVPASRRLAELLQVEIGHPLYRMVVLRFANRVPVILERGFFPCSRCSKLEEWDLEKTSIYDLLISVYGARLVKISQNVEAVAANEVIARQLRVEEGYPLLLLSRVLFDAREKVPVEYSQDFMRSDFARIHMEVDLDRFQPEE